MKLLYKQIFYRASLALAASGMVSCSEMDDTYDQFLEGGEIVYVQGADSLRVHPGYKRVKLSWLAISDPTVTRAMIYWDNGQDSMEIPIEKTDEIDTMEVLIENLEERIYNFEIYTYDDIGRSSVPTLAVGESYGDDYKNALLPRLITSALYSEETDTLEIIWGSVDPTSIGIALNYTDTLGTPREIFVPTEQTGPDSTWISDYDHQAEGRFQFRSVYLPHTLSIDTFYTEEQNVRVVGPPAPYDRTGWTATASSFDGRNGRTDRMASIALDGDNSSIWVNSIAPQFEYPHWLAVDMGSVQTETAGIWMGYAGGRNEIPRLIDIFVSDDGVEWTLVSRYGVENTGDTQYLDFPEPLDFRHFKIECLEPSGNTSNVVIGEIGAYSR